MNAFGLLIVVFALFAALVIAWTVKSRKAEERRGWRFRCVVAGQWLYEEKRETGWVGIPFPEIGDYRESPTTIGVPNPDAWRKFPDWASGRRDEIVARLKAEFKGPRYAVNDAP